MLAEAIEEWAAEAHAKGVQEGLSEGVQQGLSEGVQQGLSEGIQQGRLENIQMLRRVAAWRFGVAAGDRFGQLLAGEDTSERLTQVADLVLDCRSAEELLARTRRLLKGGNGVR